MTPRPPDRVTLLWCPVCGRDDRVLDMKPGAGRHYSMTFGRSGRCPGTPQELTYTRPVLPPVTEAGTFTATATVEVAVRPGLQHLADGPVTLVSDSALLRADSVEQVAQLAGSAVREIGWALPDQVGAHPRPAPAGWVEGLHAPRGWRHEYRA